MKTNNRKATMQRWKRVKMLVRRNERQAQAAGLLDWVAEERYYRLVTLAGSAAKAWQARKRELKALGYLTRGRKFESRLA
jgi:hypothetical protein